MVRKVDKIKPIRNGNKGTLCLIMLLFLMSCEAERSDLGKYVGRQIVSKDCCGLGYYFEFRGSGRVYVYEYDFSQYQLGDTIKASK
jgi:hypothetical protein